MIITDSNLVEAGIKDFIFVCKRQPFAITCSPYLPKIPENYVDLDLVMKLNIPMKNIQCTRLTYAGQFTRVVGQIRQTVQCVVAGKTIGTTHLKAKVVRDLNKLFHADCLASKQLYDKLMDPADHSVKTKACQENHNTTNTSERVPVAKKKPHEPDLPVAKTKGKADIYTNISTVVANNHADSTYSHVSNDFDMPSDVSFEDEDCLLEDGELMRCSITSSQVELWQCTEEDSYDRNLGYYGAITSSPSRSEANPIQTSPRAPPDRSLDPAPVVRPNASALSYPSQDISDLEGDNFSDAKLLAHHGYDAHGSPVEYDEYQNRDGDLLSNAELLAQHGYDALGNPLDQDQGSPNSDTTAGFYCRLCYACNQSESVTFSHNLLDPSCPSMDDNDDMPRDTTDEEDDIEE